MNNEQKMRVKLILDMYCQLYTNSEIKDREEKMDQLVEVIFELCGKKEIIAQEPVYIRPQISPTEMIENSKPAEIPEAAKAAMQALNFNESKAR